MVLEVTPDGYVIDTESPQAIADLSALMANLPGYALISELMKTTALNRALLPDSAEVWPGDEGYVATYDVYYAALSLLGFLQAQPVVRQSSSEGTSVAVDAPNWGGLATYYRSMSPIVQASGNGILGVVRIPDTPHVFRADMSGGAEGHDNVDTDLD